MKYEVNFNKDRIIEAKERRAAHYSRQKVDRIPFIYTLTAPVAGGWINGNPYSFGEMMRDTDKCVEGQVQAIKWQAENNLDTDWLPWFQTYCFGEGFIPSMFGATQLIMEDIPPCQEGRPLKSIYDVENMIEKIDPSKGYAPIAKEALQKMVEAFDGQVPVGITDHQSPYGIATKLIDNEELMMAMYDEPELVNKLLSVCTQAIIDTIDMISGWIGKENLVLNYNMPIPGEGGIVLWDDYVSVISPLMHKEFCAKENKKLYDKYGRGHLHTCGPYMPNYIDACIYSNPISMDISAFINKGTRTKEDILEFRKVTKENEIILVGGLTSHAKSFFDSEGITPPDYEFFKVMVENDLLLWQEGGNEENGKKYLEWLNRYYA